MKIEISCPLGHKCEKRISDDEIERCQWFVEIRGIDKTGKEHDKFDCAMSWAPVLLLEVAGTNRGQTAAIESFRNETINQQEKFLTLAGQSKKAIK